MGIDQLDTEEAAKAARVHVVTIRLALNEGDLHGIQRKAGGRWLIERECLMSWRAGALCDHRKNVTPIRRLEPRKRSA